MCEIFILGLDKNLDTIVNYFLYETSLIRRILDTSREQTNSGGFYTFSSTNGARVAKGFLVFIRKIANKLVEMQKANEEIASFLDSIPEWGEYYENELKKVNEIEARPLGQDPRARKDSVQERDPNEDDVFVTNFLNRFNRHQENLAKKQAESQLSHTDEDDDDENELKHSDSYERSGRVDPDEEMLGHLNMMDDNVNDPDHDLKGAGEVGELARTLYRSNHK